MNEDKTASSTRRHENSVARKRQRTRKKVLKIVVPLLVVAAIAGGVFLVVGGQEDDRPIAGLQTFDDLGRNHVDTPVSYPQTPPVGGEHRAVWQNCGAYNTPIPSEQGVHSLEHGAVWITYRPDLPSDQINELRSLSRQRNYTLVSPFPDLPAPVVASAWGVQVQLDSADDPRLDQFISEYMQGPQTPEPGAACSQGAGRPV